MRYLTPRNRAILREMVVTDFKVRYQGSILGYLWSLLKPLFMFAIIYVVFTSVFSLGKEVPHYPIYLLLGIVLWSFFTEATSIGLNSITSSGDIIRKISIPRYLIVVASSVSAMINLGLNLLVVITLALINGVDIRWDWLLLPLVVIELYIFAQAVAFFLAALNVKFRDTGYIWEIVLQAGFYVTPIIYPLSLVPEQFQKLILLNPVAQIIQDARYLFVWDQTVTIWDKVDSILAFLPPLIVALTIITAVVYFKKRSHTFAEDI
jgi:ABC-2 type transport system permease protein